MSMLSAPRCSRCYGPAYNINRDGEHTGAHRDLEECLSEITSRMALAERYIERLASACSLLLEGQVEAHGEICATDPCERCRVVALLDEVRP